MSNQQGAQDFSLFEDAPSNEIVNPHKPKFTFTPCTRFANLAINSQSNSNGRTKTSRVETAPATFNDRWLYQSELLKEEPHPKNLEMILEADKISIMDNKTKDVLSFSDDEEESDEGDMYSSVLGLMSSPERPFNDEPIIERNSKFQLFADDEEDEEMDQDFYDPSTSWLSSIYQNTDEDSQEPPTSKEEEDLYSEEFDENRPPRHWRSRLDKEKKYQLHNRIPLKEIQIEPELLDNGDIPAAKKKFIISNGKPQKMRIMRALSPPKNLTKRKTNLLSLTPL